MIIDISPEVEACLQQMAEAEGKSLSDFIFEATMKLHHSKMKFRDGVNEGLAQANAGQFVDETEMELLWSKHLGR